VGQFWVAVDIVIEVETNRIAGYYTLAASSIALDDIPDTLAKRLPDYQAVPVARLGCLVIDNAFRGIGLAAALLWDAVMRSIRSEIAVFALVVDAKDKQATAFYLHHGFFEFGSLKN
jgi:predicted GNAT family N-acyltransferase